MGSYISISDCLTCKKEGIFYSSTIYQNGNKSIYKGLWKGFMFLSVERVECICTCSNGHVWKEIILQ
jgi:hypothetical protein